MPKDPESNQASPLKTWAENEVASMKPAVAPKSVSEEDIQAKVAAGLSRAQAIEVLQTQAKHDAELATAEKKKAK